MQPLSTRVSIYLGIAMISIATLFATYQIGILLIATNFQTEPDKIFQTIKNKNKITSALSNISGITSDHLLKGFWLKYTDGDGIDHVVFVNVSQMAASNISDNDIANLQYAVSNGVIQSANEMRQVSHDELPPELQFHNDLYSLGPTTTTLSIEKNLLQKEQSNIATSDDLFKLSYIAEMNGDYSKRDAYNTKNCVTYGERCVDTHEIKISGQIIDKNGGIQGANVSIVSRPNIKAVTTDQNGNYSIKLNVKTMEKLRVRASKRNYSDGFDNIVVLTNHTSTYTTNTIKLESPIDIVTIDYLNKTVTGKSNSIDQDGTITLRTSRSEYKIPYKSITDTAGKAYLDGQIEVYLYEFDKSSPPENLMSLDTFDQVTGYAGNLMKTFGMPYIQFFAQDSNKELHVRKSNPMVLTYKIADMEALYRNTDNIYSPLTDLDMQMLVNASVGQPYRIDRQFLIDHQILRFPAFWVFDRTRGIWDNVGVSVLDTDGTIQTIFYTIRDDPPS